MKILRKWWFWLIIVVIILFILFGPIVPCKLLAYGDESGLPTGSRTIMTSLYKYLRVGCPV